MCRHWLEEPPVSVTAYLIAQLLGYKPPGAASGPTPEELEQQAMIAKAMFAGGM